MSTCAAAAAQRGVHEARVPNRGHHMGGVKCVGCAVVRNRIFRVRHRTGQAEISPVHLRVCAPHARNESVSRWRSHDGQDEPVYEGSAAAD